MNISQLLSILDAAEIDPRSYGLLQGSNDDGLYLLKVGSRWELFFSERGHRYDVLTYESEDEACVAFLQRIMELHVAGSRVTQSSPSPEDG